MNGVLLVALNVASQPKSSLPILLMNTQILVIARENHVQPARSQVHYKQYIQVYLHAKREMAKKPKIERTQLVKALDLLSLTFKAGEDQAMYAMMKDHKACSFNSIIALGTVIEEDIEACPHIALLATALDRCGQKSYSITQLTAEKLLVRTDDFQAYIPCLNRSLLSWPVPDALVAPLDDRLMVALKKVAVLASTKAETVIEASIQINHGSVLATNRSVIMQAWHGIDLPDGLLIPKNAVSIMHKSEKKLTGFGCSPVTATFYFEDGTWLRTQLFQDRWPPVEQHLNSNTHGSVLRAVPPELFSAAKKVAAFSGDGFVYVKDGLVSSHPFDRKEEGSELKLPIGSEHAERRYDIKNLSLISKHVIQWDEYYQDNGTMFVGENLRGVINHDPAAKPIDEDIPF